jgi:predicted Zn-dependent protease
MPPSQRRKSIERNPSEFWTASFMPGTVTWNAGTAPSEEHFLLYVDWVWFLVNERHPVRQMGSRTGPGARIALLESECERLRARDVERSAELEARERRIRLLEEALRVLKADHYGASREKLSVAPGQGGLFNEAEATIELTEAVGAEVELKATPQREDKKRSSHPHPTPTRILGDTELRPDADSIDAKARSCSSRIE